MVMIVTTERQMHTDFIKSFRCGNPELVLVVTVVVCLSA